MSRYLKRQLEVVKLFYLRMAQKMSEGKDEKDIIGNAEKMSC